MLTGKCKQDFNTWLYEKYPNNLISENCGYSYGMFERDLEQLTFVLPENMNNALIIEFFDNIKYEGKPIFSHCFNLYWTNRVSYQTHNDICLEAIKMCNKFYNEISKQIIKT